MSRIYRFTAGDAPLLVSVPHDGRRIPKAIAARMTREGKALPDTDWHVAELYDFVTDIGASVLVADYSRYVVDLNRPSDDASLYPGQVATGLCPVQTFAGAAIYREGGVDPDETRRRVVEYWRPYHERLQDTLRALRARHGFALLWDAHSIPSVVPRLFDGALPALNVGTFSGQSCDPAIESAVVREAAGSPYSNVLNGRFKGGFITRRYGDPANGVHAVQLEIAQRVYMDESSWNFDVQKAGQLRATLRRMLQSFIDAGTELSA